MTSLCICGSPGLDVFPFTHSHLVESAHSCSPFQLLSPFLQPATAKLLKKLCMLSNSSTISSWAHSKATLILSSTLTPPTTLIKVTSTAAGDRCPGWALHKAPRGAEGRRESWNPACCPLTKLGAWYKVTCGQETHLFLSTEGSPFCMPA